LLNALKVPVLSIYITEITIQYIILIYRLCLAYAARGAVYNTKNTIQFISLS